MAAIAAKPMKRTRQDTTTGQATTVRRPQQKEEAHGNRATDTKLGREVALKVLPAEMATDPERLHRFEREAKAVDDGRVKALDFGLAKQETAEVDEEAKTQLLTRAGAVLGSVPYMSTEQAQGQPVDQRVTSR